MKKKISLSVSPEWVLGSLPRLVYVNKSGEVRIFSQKGERNNFIKKAINALNITYKVTKHYDSKDQDSCYYQFNMDDIEVKCPFIFEEYDITRNLLICGDLESDDGWYDIGIRIED